MSNAISEEQVIVDLKAVIKDVKDFLKKSDQSFFNLFASKSDNNVFGKGMSDLDYILSFNNSPDIQLYYIAARRPGVSKAFYFWRRGSFYISVVDIFDDGFVTVEFSANQQSGEIYDTYKEVQCKYYFDQPDFFDKFNIRIVVKFIEYLKDLIK